jgi:hypothetical protein
MGYRKNDDNTIHTITLTAEIPLIFDSTTNAPFNLIYYYYLEKPNTNKLDRILENNLIERGKLRFLNLSARFNQIKKLSLKIDDLAQKELEKYDDLVLFGSEARYSDSNMNILLNKSRVNFLDNLLPIDFIQGAQVNIIESKSVLFKQLNDIYVNLCMSEPFYKEYFERV